MRFRSSMLYRFSLAFTLAGVTHGVACYSQDQTQQPSSRPSVMERLKRDDANQDGKVTRAEFQGPARLFSRMDRDGDGVIELAEESIPQRVRQPTNERTTAVRSQRNPARTRVLRNVVFGQGGGRDLTMHIVLPEKPRSEPSPLMVWIHGGGWMGGTKDGGVNQLARWVANGYVGATIEYRLTGEAPFPAQIEDCKCAIRFLRAHADEYGIDSERIGVAGSSAGGHLVALLGTSGDVKEFEGTGGWQDQSSTVQAVVDLYGPTDFEAFVTEPGYEAHNRDGSPESKLLGGGEVLPNQAGIKKVNPITYIDANDPPFLIIHGTADPVVPMNQSQKLHAALETANVPSKLHLIRGAKHGGKGFSSREVREMIQSFIDEHLKP
ncbi:alpha/beta hydrolase fold domain-containing protein [Rhodopirellula halodulae]|uniref:alpha/beta hydrolase fold domain-containing protein n=1 Tax=Rhodopirellula halodulae TaxID=2894198 RepID=UPI001E3002BA|nr:alpha/beta hydrolase fold domain-containing protein [Rhodopirellula sp. JC737]MCC9658653.1 alpha/beta hydrolase fold domain-containing protein [Rhodopirellula sp. JC737]